jgi:glycosyltransferase involved in cell wall biosynthesis
MRIAMVSGDDIAGDDCGQLCAALAAQGHDVTGLEVSPSRPSELAAALKTLQGEPFQREGRGAAGRSRALSRFTSERIELDASSIYQKVSSQRLTQQSRVKPVQGDPQPGDTNVCCVGPVG